MSDMTDPAAEAAAQTAESDSAAARLRATLDRHAARGTHGGEYRDDDIRALLDNRDVWRNLALSRGARLRQVEEEREAAERLVRGYQARTILRDGESRDAEAEPEPCDGDCDCDCQPGQPCLCPDRDCYCGPCRVCGETPQQPKPTGDPR